MPIAAPCRSPRRADCIACAGLVIFCILNLRHAPFVGFNTEVTLDAAIVRGERPAITAGMLPPGCEELGPLMTRLWAADATHRPTAAAALEALNDIARRAMEAEADAGSAAQSPRGRAASPVPVTGLR